VINGKDYTGKWRVNGDTMCFQYGHDSEACWQVKALAARDHWLRVEWLPKYAPELNDIENVWAKLKALHLAHLTFDSRQALDCAIHSAVEELNLRKSVIPLAKPRISA
jgi:transposase